MIRSDPYRIRWKDTTHVHSHGMMDDRGSDRSPMSSFFIPLHTYSIIKTTESEFSVPLDTVPRYDEPNPHFYVPHK